ncbi:phytanoyl-CoA dioxygenase family protein [Paenibacillus montanisoli]|uniref:Phytanoyl-CoA dioxygenase n=1 Tax=Paenibacillus montanisoli TaxID=2081970 RepID=A0A328U9D9_9BACL|nr:phytanoyl-CoA dioxygenase family protein [Paenibacillus montanisoli]RAP78433.1 hypothetical protein DL346_08415 [Paenibacillus montanisoli]
MAESIDLTKHVAEFQENGYTVFHGLFDKEQVAKWKDAFHQHRIELFGDVVHPHNINIPDMVERSPDLMLSMSANGILLDFLESIMGPFIQIGSHGFNGLAPQPEEAVKSAVVGWHRDQFNFMPRGTDYQIPRQVLALTYLEDMTAENGPLRVIPGSHRKTIEIQPHERYLPHPDEVVLSLKAGDVIVFSGVLHSAGYNTSDKYRIWLGGMYGFSWYKHPNSNFDGPNVRRLIQQAAERDDRRMLRLLGVFGLMDQGRINYGCLDPDEVKWKKWIEEDKAAFKGPADWWKTPLGV